MVRVPLSSLSLVALLSAGCTQEEKTHPPVYQPDAKYGAPKNCGEVRTGQPSGSAILVDGGIAGCATDGLTCPVADLPSFADACSKGMPVAVCSSVEWKVHCILDAGVPDAALDASDGDGSADATSD